MAGDGPTESDRRGHSQGAGPPAGLRAPGPRVAPGRLRRRLTVAFVLVAGISAGALALGSFLLVREARLRDSLQRAEREARFNLALAANLPEEGPDLQRFVAGYEQRGVHALLVTGDLRFASDPAVDPELPPSLRAVVRRGELGYLRTNVGDEPYLVVGGRAPGSPAELYFLFSEAGLEADLGQLRTVLVLGWAAVVILAGLVGRALARRTLDPVARASQAARAIAEGILATRLPVESRDEFGAWAQSFNEMAEALEAKVRALSEARARERRFTSDVAHELRTPLTALVGEASLLREHLDRFPPEARRPAELLVEDVARLRRLVDDLMEISRLDAGGEPVAAQPVPLLGLVRSTLAARGWEGRVRVGGEELTVRTDPRRVERIVSNLVGNALEHGGPHVEVTVGRDGQGTFVEVADDGPGIAPEDLPHIFDRFYKGDPSRRGPGSGLGLAIALENARLLGGDIEVRSEWGAGARFRLLLPPQAAPVGPSPPQGSPPEARPALAPSERLPGPPEPVTEPLRAREPRVTGSPHDEAVPDPEGG
ncbi:MAG TPA: HAMP domain-containing sensor histidine kinase [Actinomycetota bacterium]|nr:HAMP domain-containing sensor histidine kinase [Actinomycetota bacterium]